MKEQTIQDFRKREMKLKDDIILAMRKHIGSTPNKIIDFGDDCPEDDSHNTICAVDEYNVHIDGGTETYPIKLLSVDELINLCWAIENQKNKTT